VRTIKKVANESSSMLKKLENYIQQKQTYKVSWRLLLKL